MLSVDNSKYTGYDLWLWGHSTYQDSFPHTLVVALNDTKKDSIAVSHVKAKTILG